jgi:hypothetical protein
MVLIADGKDIARLETRYFWKLRVSSASAFKQFTFHYIFLELVCKVTTENDVMLSLYIREGHCHYDEFVLVAGGDFIQISSMFCSK